MRAGKAYISSLGTTGLLIASSLLLLAVVGAFVAFDRWPDSAAADPEVVAIAAEQQREPTRRSPAPARTDRTAFGPRASRAVLTGTRIRVPRAVAVAAAIQADGGTDTLVEVPAPADPVISDLPAPDAVAGDRGPAPAPAVAAPAPDRSTPDRPAGPRLPVPSEVDGLLPEPSAGGGDGLSAVATPVEESFETLGPALDGPVEQTGATLDGLVEMAEPD